MYDWEKGEESEMSIAQSFRGSGDVPTSSRESVSEEANASFEPAPSSTLASGHSLADMGGARPELSAASEAPVNSGPGENDYRFDSRVSNTRPGGAGPEATEDSSAQDYENLFGDEVVDPKLHNPHDYGLMIEMWERWLAAKSAELAKTRERGQELQEELQTRLTSLEESVWDVPFSLGKALLNTITAQRNIPKGMATGMSVATNSANLVGDSVSGPEAAGVEDVAAGQVDKYANVAGEFGKKGSATKFAGNAVGIVGDMWGLYNSVSRFVGADAGFEELLNAIETNAQLDFALQRELLEGQRTLESLQHDQVKAGTFVEDAQAITNDSGAQ